MKYLISLMMMLASSLAFSADPTLVITSSSSTLLQNANTLVTFTFSEPVTGFDVTDIKVQGTAAISGFSGSGSVYNANIQKSAVDINTVALVVDNNSTVPAGHGANIGFNVSPRYYIKSGNVFNGKMVESVPQPSCPKAGEVLVNADNTPAAPLNEKYFTFDNERRSFGIKESRISCLTRVLTGQKYVNKLSPKPFELNNVHGGHNHSTLMPKITQAQIPPLTGVTKVRVKPSNLEGNNPDVNGKFNGSGTGDARFGNLPAKFETDDPIVFPNGKGKAHLHTFYGNNSVNYQTNSASLIKNCVSSFAGGIANCTGYWMPSTVDVSSGTALLPVDILMYYKAGTMAHLPYIEPLPQGLKIIAGNPSASSLLTQTDRVRFECFRRDGGPETDGKNFRDCSGDIYSHMFLTVAFPNCVADDGKGGMQLDSPNHRSHLAHDMAGNPQTTFNHCPTTHPHRIASISQIANFEIPLGSNTSTWRLSSDNYSAGLPGGFSAHADWWGGWQVYWANRLNTQCNTKIINCVFNYIGLNDGVPITNITTIGNIATLTTQFPHLLKNSNADGTYPDSVGSSVSQILRGRLTGVIGASASTYNFDVTKVTNTHIDYPIAGGTINPVGSQNMKITGPSTIEITLPATPTTLINGAVDPANVKLQWGEEFCNLGGPCAPQAYSDFYYGNKQ